MSKVPVPLHGIPTVDHGDHGRKVAAVWNEVFRAYRKPRFMSAAINGGGAQAPCTFRGPLEVVLLVLQADKELAGGGMADAGLGAGRGELASVIHDRWSTPH
mmetsp:Transcript_22289/g.67763  ORF Transcript_22289/g.67763 Transcript_22289/m.67763 type:complete len:102 (+) Transcript_22289:265-570(+)|eukprot:scaffold241422_cov32-Tisochrysis_lutea.AAC.1